MEILQGKLVIEEHDKDIVLDIAEGLSEGIHDLILFKRSDAAHYFDFYGVMLEKGCHLEKPQRQKVIEELNVLEILYQQVKFLKLLIMLGKYDPEGHEGIYSNSWYSYSMMTARNLGAEINNNAQGGIAVLDGTGYFNPSLGYRGLESTYDKLRYSAELG